MRRLKFYLLADLVSLRLLQEMMEDIDLTHLILSLRDFSGRRCRFYLLADLVSWRLIQLMIAYSDLSYLIVLEISVDEGEKMQILSDN